MDEPTNDLDLETLELLEGHLSRYPGTLIIVSHDRAFLDNVVTSIIAMEGGGRVSECVGGYSDWFRHRPPPPEPVKPSKDAPKGKVGPARAKPDRRRRLGYQEGRELEALPGRIETLEARIASLQGRLADPGLYRREPGAIADLKQELATAESELAVAFERWSELESVDRRL